MASALGGYGPKRRDGYRRLAHCADRILKRAPPSSLPVGWPARLDTAINLETAKALGDNILQSLLLRADEVTQ